jgi:hypothetical protein
MPRVFINNCSIEELMSVPGVGAKGADKILELREAKGDLELDDLNQVPYLRITPQLLDCLDFTSFENKEGVGSLYNLHRERDRSVDKLIGKWVGTGQGQVKGRGKDMGSFDRAPLSRGKSYYSKQEGDWWQQSNLPDRVEDEYSEMETTFMERQTPGDLNVHQLRDNLSRHPFVERVVTILIGIRAAMRGIGHICTTCILETRIYVRVMRSLGNQVFFIVGF